jgi:hypothetical protein
MDFAKRSNRKGHIIYKPVLEYDNEKLENGYKKINKRDKCYV